MIKVAICGYRGRMGSAVVSAVLHTSDMELVCAIDPRAENEDFPTYSSLSDALKQESFEVVVDFTQPDVVAHNIKCALNAGVNCVVGTTGLTHETLEKLSGESSHDATLFYAPNFTTGAVLMMEFAGIAAKYFKEAEIIEFHHGKKKDAPSGTAIQTAKKIASQKQVQSGMPGRTSELPQFEGARGAYLDDIAIHSVRSSGFVASQEVIFGSMGQTLTIRHDSWDRDSYMPGVLLGIRKVIETSGLIIGLENFMQ